MIERPTDSLPKSKVNKASLNKTKQLFAYIQPYKWYFFAGMLCLIFSSTTVMAFPKSIGLLVDASLGKASGMINQRSQVAILLFVIILLQSIFSFSRVWFFTQVNERALANIRRDLYNKMICLPIPYFEEKRVGELNSRITNDVSALQDTLSITLAEFFRQTATLAIGIGLLFYRSVHLTLVMLMSFPVIIVLAIFFGKFIRNNSKKTQDALAEANIVVNETFQGVNIVKAYTNELFESKRFDFGVTKSMDLGLKGGIYRGAFISFIIFALFGSFIFVLWQGSGLVELNTITKGAQGITLGALIEFLMYTIFIGGSLAGMSDTYTRLLKAVGASERIVDILNSEQETDTKAFTYTKLNGSIEFQDVNFCYPTRSDVQVLKDMNFDIKPGEKVALVGPSGAGKSTIVQLLLKFYAINSGKILIDGKNITDLSVKELRSNMAIVPQEVMLFGGTIKENILYGKLDATDEELLNAAQKANAWEFISKFPDGLNTVVGERGIKLSGGQRQRIAIARAILKDPAILLLDEATSALDAESEKLVQAALDTLMEGRTTIIIAHRLSTIRNVDKILVMNQGKIVEEGNHQALSVVEDGLYNHLLKLQYQMS
ncbi:MAG TPA: ABC transporter transmembrane domain-containing protein [Chitinophagales bacterium]|jgi:ABC-type multidrug transport system fused ATPase/permease subunit|nr:ABC transporter transmembrane domain-containing protein [Chitinophagales bacterium]